MIILFIRRVALFIEVCTHRYVAPLINFVPSIILYKIAMATDNPSLFVVIPIYYFLTLHFRKIIQDSRIFNPNSDYMPSVLLSNIWPISILLLYKKLKFN